MNWSAEQQRQLGAMGYQLMVRVAAGTAPLASEVAGRAGANVDATADGAGAAKGAAVGSDSRLAALQRAVDRAAGDIDASELVEDLERLRREPALKRALWPKLRALRRSH